MLRWRLLLGTLVIAALLGLCWLDHAAAVPGVWLMPVAVLLAWMAGSEVLALAEATGAKPLPWAVYTSNLLIVLAAWVPRLEALGNLRPALEPGTWPLAALGLGALLVFLGEMRRYESPGGVTANVSAAVFAMVYVGVLLAVVVQMRMVWGIGSLAALVIVVKMGDTGAYTVGRLIGRHKMAPKLSPGKTIEGMVGGLGFSCLGAWVAFAWLVPALSPGAMLPSPGSSYGWLIFGLLVGAAGMIGDLAESLLKRDAGRKDSSTWLPGFGGVLDILDSILLAAPVAWLCWAVGIVGR